MPVDPRKILEARGRLLPTVPPVQADHAAKLRVFDALLREAVSLGALPLRNPLQDLETDIALAAAVNAVGG